MKQKLQEIEQYDFLDPELLNKNIRSYAYQIGKYLMHFSEIEHELNLAITSAINTCADEQGYQIVKYLRLERKIDFTFNTYKVNCFYTDIIKEENKPGVMASIETLKKKITEEKDFRNILAHANWTSLGEDGYVRHGIVEKEGRILMRTYEITPKIIKEHIERIDEILDELYTLQENLGLD